MRGIAEQRHALGAPVVDRLAIEERPAVALVALRRVDDRLDLRMPAAVGRLELFPRTTHGPGLLIPRRVPGAADEVEELAAPQPVHDAMILWPAPDGADQFHEIVR